MSGMATVRDVHFDNSSLFSRGKWRKSNIRVFHGYDYEEYRLLEYEIPVRTSQETHYVSLTEPSLLMLCKI
jgi:hypothetical protein